MNPNTTSNDAYEPLFTGFMLPDEEYVNLDLSMSDTDLQKMLVDDLNLNIAHWEQKPWQLKKTDAENTAYLLGDQNSRPELIKKNSSDDFTDNRMFSSMRAILSYATGRLAIPEITPSRSDEVYVKGARKIQSAIYQHALDNKVDIKTRAAVMNLLSRKRGPMKLRWDPNKGLNGDIVTEVVPPEDIIIDRYAGFLDNPRVIYQRIRCSVDELVNRFPNKKSDIYQTFSIKLGNYNQRSRFATYYEAWFTYLDNKGNSCEGVAWFLEQGLILDKQKNPNWVYTGTNKKEREINVLDRPPKPYVWFNYINTGHSYIDDTCLFEQAKPLQEMLNYRNQQLNRNIDFMNGRWVASKKAFSEEDAQKFVNRGSRTVALVDADDVGKAIQAMTPGALPAEVYQSVVDFRNEIDTMMGTPSQFRGAAGASQDTATRDLMIKQQAGALQDDLVRCVASGMEEYYKILLQMMRTYYTDDYWFQVRGGDGQFEFILLNSDEIDSNVKVGVQVDSTLPLDKEQIRATSLSLWKEGNAIDYKTLMEDLGLPEPDIRAERYYRAKLDPIGYMESLNQGIDNDDAEVDIQMLVADKVPEERDDYDEDYLNYFNHFLTLNRFSKLPQDAKQRIVQFLMAVQHIASGTENMQADMAQPPAPMLDDAGMLSTPPAPPAPKQQVNIDVKGTPLDATQTAQATGVQQAAPAQPPVPTQ